MPYKSVIYASRGRRAHAHSDFHEMVEAARTAHARDDICGMLVFDGFCYLHILEGAREVVDALMARIVVDERHSGLRVLTEQRASAPSSTTFSAGTVPKRGGPVSLSRLVRGADLPESQLRQICVDIVRKARALR